VDAEGEAFVKVLSFDYLSTKTRDLEKSVCFYCEGFEKIPTCNSSGISVIRCHSGFMRKEAARCQKRFEPCSRTA
jgi:hypothetical protein